MTGRGRLCRGLERLLPNHSTAFGKALRREYDVYLASFGIDGDPPLQREASRAALLALRAREASRVWVDLVERRKRGRGRRPSERRVERAARRAALDDQAAAQALDRLRELAQQTKPLDLTRAIQEAARANGSGS